MSIETNGHKLFTHEICAYTMVPKEYLYKEIMVFFSRLIYTTNASSIAAGDPLWLRIKRVNRKVRTALLMPLVHRCNPCVMLITACSLRAISMAPAVFSAVWHAPGLLLTTK